MASVAGKHIVLAVTGGIAAYKAADLASRLVKIGADVHVCMTEHACEFVTPLTFETLTKNRVVTDTFDRSRPFEVQHVSLGKLADMIVVAPATANMIAKAANGIADDFVSTLLITAKCPEVFAPAMNTAMYENDRTHENILKLKRTGRRFIEPGTGMLACGDTGKGRMAEPSEIADYVAAYFERTLDLSGKTVVVTAGPTIEKIDDVRYITNRSTGRMGYELAEAARDRGAEVILVSGKTCLEPPFGVKVINVTSAGDMKDAVLSVYADADAVIMAAAVADYTPAEKTGGKIKKGGEMTLRLVRTEDILETLGRDKGGRKLIGFAAEAENLERNALEKLSRKNLDMIAANDISRNDIGFGTEENSVRMFFRDGTSETVEKCPKREVADRIIDALVRLYG